MFKKVILQGQLEFGKERSYRLAFEMFEHLVDVRYKTALLIDEEHFSEETHSLVLGRMVLQASEKYFKNTISLIEQIAQFSISGNIGAWMVNEGTLLESRMIEPTNDKVVVQQFLKGRELSEKKGKEQEALEALEVVLGKYDKHSQAYERRGYLNYRLKNLEDALYDFTKSIKLYDRNAASYLGRGQIHFERKEFQEAVNDFEQATKTSVALQPMYWVARRKKAHGHIKLKQWKEAAFDLKLYTRRKFPEGDNNELWKKWAFSEYGMTLMELGQYEEAIEAFDEALSISEGHGKVNRASQLLKRGIAKKENGGSGYLSDWKEAATLGEKKAKKLLESVKK